VSFHDERNFGTPETARAYAGMVDDPGFGLILIRGNLEYNPYKEIYLIVTFGVLRGLRHET
jgi:hypothetical protein